MKIPRTYRLLTGGFIVFRCYSNLRKSFRRKIIAESRWTDENDPDIHCCRLARSDIDSMGEEDETHEELHGDTKYCYCRANAEKDHLIGCDNENCRITWYHQSCVGFESEEEIPKGEYVCPRCKGEDHWCLCGNEEGKWFSLTKMLRFFIPNP